jgi:hypothetical protein
MSSPVNFDQGPDTEFIICGGNAKPTDTHLASIVHCIDEEIFDFLKRREKRKQRRIDQ